MSAQPTAPIFIGDDYLFDLGIPTEVCDREGMISAGMRLARMASASLRFATIRADNDADLPRTFQDATEGAAILIQLALSFMEAGGVKELGEQK